MKTKILLLIGAVMILTAILSGCAANGQFQHSRPVYDPMLENVSFILDPIGHVMFRKELFCDYPGCEDKYPQGQPYSQSAPYYQNEPYASAEPYDYNSDPQVAPSN